ncbi:MAG TPA: peptidase M16 [Methyloprofundus sp.]|nr:peptidase M16 [Methyloprofundus sp.]HIL77556.1 peptidase M16 [Methylococcales bacterium]
MFAYFKLPLLLVLLLTSACTSIPPTMESKNIIQSQNDSRHYQAFTLNNGLKVLIISDPETKKAAASLDVFVGSASDPEDRAGLAHFLEHMLFLGTEKYPDADEYQTFIAQHGGSRNAFTAKEHTNYFFDIENSSLEPTLDRFSQFFTAPLFNAEFVEREKNAVNSEYLGKIKTENRRFYAGIQQALNPKSPYAKFSVGSLETLADRESDLVRDDLLTFYNTHYSANLMTLVVLANEPLPVLKKWVTDKFSAIPDHNAEKKVFSQPLLTQAQMAQQINIKSLQEKRELNLIFPLPEVQSHYLAKPSAYFQSLLGHEGKGSILALLKEKGWADELSASIGISNNAQESSLHLGINLTLLGLQHTDEIIGIVFQYIRLLQNNEIQEWLFQEQSQMAALQFRYQEQHDASSTVTGLARNLQYYAPEDILRGPYIIEQFKPELSAQLIAQLTPERVLVALNSQDIKTDSTEKNYQVEYQITPIAAETIQTWNESPIDPALSLPAANPFIPNELNLKTAQPAPEQATPAHPELILQNSSLDLWHQLDTSFNVPRSNLYIALQSPIANKTPKDSLLTALLTGIIKKQLNSYAYPARLAGLSYSIYATERGMSIALSGYDQKQPVLLEQIIADIKAPEITVKRFNILKARYQQKLTNAKKQQPFKQVLAELKRTLIERRWTNEQKLSALSSLTREDLTLFAEAFLKQLHVTMLLQGNNTASEAETIAAMLSQEFALPADAPRVPAAGIIQLAGDSLQARRLTIDNHDAALALYFQGVNKSAAAQAEAQLLGRIIGPAFFADLRTRQQLAYNLGAAALPMKDMPGIIFIMQSPVISAPEIEARYHAFITSYLEELQAISEDDLESYKAGLITRLMEKNKSLHKRSYQNWLEIDRENIDFDTRERLAEAVGQIDKERLIAVYKDWLIDNPRQLRSYALGNQFINDDFSDPELITDIDTFKREHNKL